MQVVHLTERTETGDPNNCISPDCVGRAQLHCNIWFHFKLKILKQGKKTMVQIYSCPLEFGSKLSTFLPKQVMRSCSIDLFTNTFVPDRQLNNTFYLTLKRKSDNYILFLEILFQIVMRKNKAKMFVTRYGYNQQIVAKHVK